VTTPIVVIGGPTAGGKSALALAVARAFDGVVINADSLQVYRELAVLTARPGAAELAQAPHRLYGVLPAAAACSAGRWRALARAEIDAAAATGRLPVLVGGTGLYLRALSHGLAPVPAIPAELRAAAADRLARLGPAAFHAELARRDPVMAGRLRPGDRQRLLRAWEVVEATGRSLADWQRAPRNAPDGLAIAAFVVAPPRAALHAACDGRFVRMLAAGALDEARAIAALDLDPGLPAMKALGLRELQRHLRGELTLAAAAAAAQAATRRYAKRQLTWFRHQMPEAHWLGADASIAQDSQRIETESFTIIRRFLLTLLG
jgi:tRNA dimethylallyltransferase